MSGVPAFMAVFADVALLVSLGLGVYPVVSGRAEVGVEVAALQACLLAVLGVLLAIVEGRVDGGADAAGRWAGAMGVALAVLVVQGTAVQALLRRIARQSRHIRETPDNRPGTALLSAGALVTIAFGVSWSMPGMNRDVDLLVPTAFALLLLGLQRVVTRRRAAGQAGGLLLVANGLLLATLRWATVLPALPVMALLFELAVCLLLLGAVSGHLDREPGPETGDRLG